MQVSIGPKTPLVQGVAAGALALTLCTGFLFWTLQLWRADLRIPFGSAMPTIHDIEFNEMLVKSMVDTGWCFRNRFLGAPFGMQLYDFPPWDNLSMSMMKLVSLFTSNYAADSQSLLFTNFSADCYRFAGRLPCVPDILSVGNCRQYSFCLHALPFHAGRGAHLLGRLLPCSAHHHGHCVASAWRAIAAAGAGSPAMVAGLAV